MSSRSWPTASRSGVLGEVDQACLVLSEVDKTTKTRVDWTAPEHKKGGMDGVQAVAFT